MEYVHIWEKWMNEKNVLIARYEDLLMNYEVESAKLVEYLKIGRKQARGPRGDRSISSRRE